jgi:plastocyanin
MKRSVVIAIVIAVIVVIAGALALNKKNPTASPTPSPSNQAAASPTPTASPGTSPTPSPAAAEGTTTDVSASGFTTSPIKVTSGQTLTFVNKSDSTIQVDSSPHPQHTDNPELNVGQIAPGASKSVTPVRKGTFGIHNHLNPSQQGSVIVE